MIHVVKGNLLCTHCDYICQQVNCRGVMGAGLAKNIKRKWPLAQKEYYNYIQANGAQKVFGTIQIVKVNDSQSVVNMFAQYHYGRGKRQTSYEAFYNCLEAIVTFVPKGASIAMPYGIGCGLGGADIEIINTMIRKMLSQDYEVYLYEL